MAILTETVTVEYDGLNYDIRGIRNNGEVWGQVWEPGVGDSLGYIDVDDALYEEDDATLLEALKAEFIKVGPEGLEVVETVRVAEAEPDPRYVPGTDQYTDGQCVVIREAFQELAEHAARAGMTDAYENFERKLNVLRAALGMEEGPGVDNPGEEG